VSAQDDRVSFAGACVRVGAREWNVRYPVRDARLVGCSVVVLYDYTAGPRHRQFQNVQAFDRFGGLLWTAEHPTAETVDAYIEIVDVAPLILWNFACYRCTLDPCTGKLLDAKFIEDSPN
jgi:hypothetical protein